MQSKKHIHKPDAPISEALLIFLIGAVQFIDILDFMMVMPLGPDFSKDLNFDMSKMGYISGAYTFAAAISGLVSSIFLDQFDRKKLLFYSLLGLAIATFLGGISKNVEFLLFSRFVAGAFGGPATAASFAIIADLVEPQRRGAAMGKVWGAFSIASVIGVPFGLELARMTHWQMPFFALSLISIIISLLIAIKLPPVRKHLDENIKRIKVTYWSLLNNKNYIVGYLTASLSTMAAFMIIPYISPQLQINLHLPRSDISLQYFVGGILSFFAMRLAGYFVDKYSATFTTLIGSMVLSITLFGGFIYPELRHYLPIIFLFAPFMIGMSMRNVSSSTNFSKMPTLFDRAGFMSLISCFQHLFSSLGAILSSKILYETKEHYLENMDYIAIISLILFFITIPLVGITEKLTNSKRA